jgi:hypothetical protein
MKKRVALRLREIAINRAPCAHFEENGICEIPFRGLLRKLRRLEQWDRAALGLIVGTHSIVSEHVEGS